MSTNGNQWKPLTAEKWICPTGQVVWIRQPGPELTIRLGRLPKAVAGNMPPRRHGQTEEEYDRALEEYTREALQKVDDEEIVTSARQLLVAMLESPKLVLNPRHELGELGPDDTGIDFWPLYEHGMNKYFRAGRKLIKAGEGEVEEKDLETFRAESGVSGDSVDSIHISVAESEPAVADSGLVNGAGS